MVQTGNKQSFGATDHYSLLAAASAVKIAEPDTRTCLSSFFFCNSTVWHEITFASPITQKNDTDLNLSLSFFFCLLNFFLADRVNDRVVSANGISLENVDYATAVEVLRKCGAFVNLLIRRRVLLHPPSDIQAVTLTKNKKKDEFGLVLGCRIFIKEINNKALMGKDSSLQEGDVILKVRRRC